MSVTIDSIKTTFAETIIELSDAGDATAIRVKPDSITSVCRALKASGFDYPASITGVDRIDRIELVYHLTALETGEKVIIKTDLDREKPAIDSVYSVWKGADWQEREIYDLLGVVFIGHPELRRILLPDNWEGYPLRKDYVMPEDDMHGLPKDWSELGDPEPELAEVCRRTEDGGYVCEPVGTLHTEEVQISMGPQHPSTHGVLRLELILDGETVVDCRPDVGYLHRGMEKLAESRTYIQYMPLTDRFDYLSSIMNNAVYCGAIEKLAAIEVPERIEYIRVIMMELQRIASHLVFIGTMGLDLGATTPFLYSFREREDIIDIFEATCGARLTYNYFRPGGLSRDIPEGFESRVRAYIKKQRKMLPEYDDLLTGNQIFLIRTRDVGIVSAEDAADFAMSGPNIRASGVPYDVRRSDPYSIYDRFDFEVVTEPAGDCLARYMVRRREIEQSLNIVEQALDGLPEGTYKYKLPAVFKVPEGEVYHHIESSRGDLGCYIISDGTAKPYRLKWRAPSFITLQALPQMVRGWKVADTVAILGTTDVVLGEVDR